MPLSALAPRSTRALLWAACAAAALSGCHRPRAHTGSARSTWGGAMAEVGRRFEVLGRASLARRAELARYQAGELEELFSEALAHAEPPHEGHPEQLPALRRAFVEGPLRALTQELARPEQRELAQVFAQTAAACNGCHQASGHGFIEVSPALGSPVPRLDPLP